MLKVVEIGRVVGRGRGAHRAASKGFEGGVQMPACVGWEAAARWVRFGAMMGMWTPGEEEDEEEMDGEYM
eukprot:49327-Pleurochrysis_carterae.AAC.1